MCVFYKFRDQVVPTITRIFSSKMPSSSSSLTLSQGFAYSAAAALILCAVVGATTALHHHNHILHPNQHQVPPPLSRTLCSSSSSSSFAFLRRWKAFGGTLSHHRSPARRSSGGGGGGGGGAKSTSTTTSSTGTSASSGDRAGVVVVGLVGGIASGKSTVAELMRRRHGATVLSADVLGHETYADHTCDGFREIVAAFGEGVLKPIVRPTTFAAAAAAVDDDDKDDDSGGGAEGKGGGEEGKVEGERERERETQAEGVSESDGGNAGCAYAGMAIDRAALRRVVFGTGGDRDGSSAVATAEECEQRRQQLQAIVWPKIRRKLEDRIACAAAAAAAAEEGEGRGEAGDTERNVAVQGATAARAVVVIEAALLFEAGWQDLCDEVWAVRTDEARATDRLLRRDNRGNAREREGESGGAGGGSGNGGSYDDGAGGKVETGGAGEEGEREGGEVDGDGRQGQEESSGGGGEGTASSSPTLSAQDAATRVELTARSTGSTTTAVAAEDREESTAPLFAMEIDNNGDIENLQHQVQAAWESRFGLALAGSPRCCEL